MTHSRLDDDRRGCGMHCDHRDIFQCRNGWHTDRHDVLVDIRERHIVCRQIIALAGVVHYYPSFDTDTRSQQVTTTAAYRYDVCYPDVLQGHASGVGHTLCERFLFDTVKLLYGK